MNCILFDSAIRCQLLPFTHTRPVADIRCGILTMRERWEFFLKLSTGTLTERYMQPVFPLDAGSDNLYINGAVFGNKPLVDNLYNLLPGQKLVKGDLVIGARLQEAHADTKDFDDILAPLPAQHYEGAVYTLNNIWDIFSLNEKAIREDFDAITCNRQSAEIPAGVTVAGSQHLFIEEGARIYPGCVINAMTGPVYIGKDAEVLEGTLIRGPLAMCEHAVIKMGGKIYGATTLGPGCKVGGEISNVVFFANSNKGHDGYLGNAVVGEWCNLGADTNCSNLKNNYDGVKIWAEHKNKSVYTGLTFCGLLMADHSKCGINTMFNTGTVVGVSANIFGGGFPQKFIPSFSWGGSDGTTTYDFNKAMDTANRMMARRGKQLSEAEMAMYHHIFDNTAEQRNLFGNNSNES